MKNIFGIFRADFRRISNSVVASVVIIGLCLVPCLYAWFNILSNWDPYGEASTSNIKVAVANEDRGAKLMGMELNIGTLVMDGLAANHQLGWVFVDDRQQALEGVYSGDYYAALIVSKDFTRDFISLLDNDLRHPQIEYYENEKKNAIAPKITNKAKTAVQEQVNNTVVEKAAGAINTISSVLRAFGVEADDVSNGLTSGLDSACDSLEQISALLAALRDLTGNMDNLLDAAHLTIYDLGEVMESSAATADAANTTIINFAGSMNDFSHGTDEILTKIDSQYKDLLDKIQTGGTDAVRKDSLRDSLSSLSADILTVAAQSVSPEQAALLNNAASYVDETLGYVDTIETDRDAAAACLQNAADCLADALTIQDEIDRSLNTLNSLAQELSDETASWCSVLQNEADTAAADEDAGDSTESALAALTPLIDNFIIEAQSAQTIIPSLDVLCAVAEQYQLDVADIGSETGRDLCITDTTSMLDEIDAVIATQYSNIGVGGLLESNYAALLSLKAQTDALRLRAANWTSSSQAKQDILDSITALEDSLNQFKDKYPNTSASIDSALDRLDNLYNLIETGTGTMDEMLDILDKVREALYTAAITINNSLNGFLQDHAGNAEAVLTTVRDLLSGYADKMFGISQTIGGYGDAIGSMQGTLSDSIALTNTVRIYLKQISDDIRRFTSSDAFNELVEILENNPDSLSDYLASPVELNTVVVYEIKDYGSAMAPYYIMLALFVGSLLSATMIKVPVKYPEYLTCNPLERYFGRKMLFNGIVLAQAIITALGCMFYVGMQSVNPLLLILACCICSLNFMAMNYALVYALDNIGMAIAVIIMVIQVAGSGGSYPVHVLPEFFQKLYNFMPFHYGMDMIRETIGGFYGHTYLRCAVILLLMCVGFAIFGLLVYYPAKPLNRLIAESKEKSGIM